MASSSQYEEAIERAKAALESYSAEAEELARLYETARQNARARYESQKKESAAQAAEQKRRAGIETQRTERSLDQRLASRGLALSGENAQTSLDLLVALRNQLAGIDSDRRSRDAALDAELADKQHELDLSFAQQRAESAERQASLASDLAAAEANREAALAAEKAAAAASKAASAGRGSASGPQKADGETGGKGIADYLAEKGLSDAAKNPKQFGDTLGRTSGSAVGSFTGKSSMADGSLFGETHNPEVKAAALAKQMVASAGRGGKVLTLPQQAALKAMLDNVLSNYRLSEEYEAELLFNLRSMGYNPKKAAAAADAAEELRKQGEHAYEVGYRVAYGIYCHAGYSANDLAALVERSARADQLNYLYEHSQDEDQFEYVVSELGLSNYLESFYERAEKQKLELGGALK